MIVDDRLRHVRGGVRSGGSGRPIARDAVDNIHQPCARGKVGRRTRWTKTRVPGRDGFSDASLCWYDGPPRL